MEAVTQYSNMEHKEPPQILLQLLENRDQWVKKPGKISTLMKHIRANIVGINTLYSGPFGKRQVVYCDCVASGKPMRCIEEHLLNIVLPYYANTHTTTSITAIQTGTLREQAREIIKKCVNATDEDVVIFTGSGSTSAIHKIINAIGLHGDKAENTLVLTGPYEHHSNILPWENTGAIVTRLPESSDGTGLDMDFLKQQLQAAIDEGREVIATLSAASNITGYLSDTDTISDVIHQYGGLVFWDCACAGPYAKLDMHPSKGSYKDALFISVHKFLGGPGSPGVLVARKSLFTNHIPGGAGGGTVSIVSRKDTVYLDQIEEREEGGTPDILGSIKAGLAFQLKQEIGSETIERIEYFHRKKAFRKWQANENLFILGRRTSDRLPIFSFLINHPLSGKYLHHNFISTLLNDLYGIQARGGCACAGPYGMDLLGISDTHSQNLVELIRDGEHGIPSRTLHLVKPGFARLNFPFYYGKDVVDYIIEAVDKVATHGWKLLPLYKCDRYSASFMHRFYGGPKLNNLLDMQCSSKKTSLKNRKKIELKAILKEADSIYAKAQKLCRHLDLDEEVVLGKEYQDYQWFLLPSEALLYLYHPQTQFKSVTPSKLEINVNQHTPGAYEE